MPRKVNSSNNNHNNDNNRIAGQSQTPGFTSHFVHNISSTTNSSFIIPFFQRQSSRSSTNPNSSFSTQQQPAPAFTYSLNFDDNNPTIQRKPNFNMSSAESSDTTEFNLEEFVENFKRNVSIKDRRWRLQTFKNVFVGSDAVNWMVTSGVAETREDAVALGLMMQEAGYIEHTVRDHDFKDGHLFYKFIEDEERGGVPKLDEGRLVSWGDFLGNTTNNERDFNAKMPAPSFDDNSKSGAINITEGPDTMFWPKDEENVRLLDNVHPPEWIPPTFDGTYDLLVIGAGAGGLVTSSGAAGVGAKVALIEANVLGGDCLNVGCVPSKSLIHTANLAHTLRNTNHLAESGISFSGAVQIDFGQTMKRLRKIRADISKNDSAQRYTRLLGVDVYFGYARFQSEQSVLVNDKLLTFRKAVIATGASPVIPAIPGMKDLHEKSVAEGAKGATRRTAVMTNETFFNMTELPKRLAVIGTGVIGMELGQAMQRLGSNVTIFGRSGKVLPKEDEDLADIIKQQMVADGVKFQLHVDKYRGVKLSGEVSDNGYEEMVFTTEEREQQNNTTDAEEAMIQKQCEYKFDAILVAAGRKPNVANMDLEAAGVKYESKRGLIVSDNLQTTNAKIYGVGDCCSEYKFTHAADFMARMVIRNSLFIGKDKMSNLIIPYATFTSPEIAHVGLYEQDMRQKGIAFKTFEKEFEDNDRAICESNTKGLVRIHVEEKSDTILGASIVGEGAGNMISELTLAMQSKTGLGTLAGVIHPYPTMAEAIRQTGDLYSRTRLTNAVRQVLRGVIKVQR